MTRDGLIMVGFGAVMVGLVVAWIAEPPSRSPGGAVPSPTAIVQRDEPAERELCRRAADGSADPAWLAEQSRRAEIRYSLATMAAAGDVGQLLASCRRAGYR